MNPLRILTNFADLNETHSGEIAARFSYFTDDARPREFLKQCLDSDLLILNTDPKRLMLACALKWLIPFARFKIVSVDLIVRTPKSLRGRIKTFIQKLLFKRVHRFGLYFKDLRGCEKFYGIGADRAVFVPFKVNALDSIKRRMAAGSSPAGDNVMCAGRTMRDVKTFVAAMRRTGCPGILHQQPKDLMAAHGTYSCYRNHKCRCAECRAAHSDHMRTWRKQASTYPAERIPHGSQGYRNYSCRCEVCRAAKAAERLK